MSLIHKQLFDDESGTYTYIVADEASREALIIDSVRDQLERDLQVINDLNLKLKYILETHVHADHITGARFLKEVTGAQIGLSKYANIELADLQLDDNDELGFGEHKLKVIYTPGHTNTCNSYLVEDMLFSGDCLMIHKCGRTDFQQGCAKTLYQSITQKLYTLPDETKVYPGHEYEGKIHSSIAEEKKENIRVKEGTSEEDFITTMNALKLAQPKKIKLAVPANMQCGLSKIINVDETKSKLNDPSYYLIDTRSEEEHTEACIPNTPLIVHTEILNHLDQIPKDKNVVLYCRSGRRSASAQMELEKHGYENIYNMTGGILAWQAANYPIEAKV